MKLLTFGALILITGCQPITENPELSVNGSIVTANMGEIRNLIKDSCDKTKCNVVESELSKNEDEYTVWVEFGKNDILTIRKDKNMRSAEFLISTWRGYRFDSKVLSFFQHFLREDVGATVALKTTWDCTNKKPTEHCKDRVETKYKNKNLLELLQEESGR